MLAASSIAVSDLAGNPCDHAGRGGMGAVLGSKKIKAIVINDRRTKQINFLKDRKDFIRISKDFTQKLLKTKVELKKYGTAIEVAMSNELGYLPTRNYSKGMFEGADKITGEQMHANIAERGGSHSKACMPGCPIKCSNIYNDKKSDYLTASLEYETIVMLGANCGINDLDAVAKMDRLCDDYGLDTIEMGAAIAVAMEAKVLPFGNAEAAISMLKEIPQNSPLCRIIGNGAEITGRIFGVTRTPSVKGQSMAGYDPRRNKGLGVTYMSSPMGADHTAGCVMPGRKGLDPSKEFDMLESKGQEELSLDLQIMTAIFDSMGLCFFIGLSPETIEVLVQLHQAAFGIQTTFKDLIDLGRDVLRTEYNFNIEAGISPISKLPEFFEIERLNPYPEVFDVNYDKVSNHFQSGINFITKKTGVDE
jgi:aldehyde:ferredoxin oxidoreductase